MCGHHAFCLLLRPQHPCLINEQIHCERVGVGSPESQLLGWYPLLSAQVIASEKCW